MRKAQVFLLLMTACLSLPPAACRSAAPARSPENDPSDRRLAAAKQRIMVADYHADLAGLARLREEAARLEGDPALGYLAHYWAGFASWRIAMNGASHQMSVPDLQANLQKAKVDFEASIHQKDDFADAYAAAFLVDAWLVGMSGIKDRAALLEQYLRIQPRLKRAKELAPDNPRVLWAEASVYLYAPPENGGNRQRALETYRRMSEVSPAVSDASSPLPDWGKPEALMSLAFSHLSQKPPDLDAAREEAHAALRLQPEWSYVRDVLLPQIEAARHP
jgi:tetratricopeptide (TPR) repeat protein